MRVRTLLVATAVLSAILGAVAAYLVLTVPNDIQAAALMRTARKQIAAGDNDRARQSLSRIVQQYPRTDAAAAAMVALTTLADSERHKLQTEIEALRTQQNALQKQLAVQGERVQTIENRPAPAPVIIHEAAKAPPAKKKTTARKRR